ncbi:MULTISPECIES: hypothetical protein [Vibrio]|uniref:hypothetical protein n=1 Tax=Vibrio TaxID=662 RepID=UPI0004DECCBE|nr:hypothetical protein [Vibrio parahaemolyticus]EGQ9239483.1 hypothetical protein [Vibrio vulnificus]EHD1698125.1 hypothetical protein [Vibrio vulnificus]EKZ9225854.1 hypothetical protein [Vibrio vulnificus]ELC9582696.1 hypothetical protein [Vibrio vulnificus]MCU8149767.1 hypothetical protein [Vibrio vulnificus]
MKFKKQLPPRSKQRGNYILLGLVLAVIIGGILTAQAVSSYNQQTASTERDNLRQEMLRFFATMKENKRAYGSYVGTNNQSVWQSNKLISQTYKSTTANQFVTPYTDDGIDFAPVSTATDRTGKTFTSANNYIQVTLKDVPIEQCSDTVDDYIDVVTQVMVGTSRVHSIPTRDAACASGTKVNIVLTNL